MDNPFFFENTTYWSEGDEKAHFDWLDGIKAVRDVRGIGLRLYLNIDHAIVDADDIRELEAVYRRYGGELAQLQELKEALNAPN